MKTILLGDKRCSLEKIVYKGETYLSQVEGRCQNDILSFSGSPINEGRKPTDVFFLSGVWK